MEETILISYLNDFMFCPISIYFHKLYGNLERTLYQREEQLAGTASHKTIDTKTYTTSKNVLQGIEVYSSKYNIIGKIDMYDKEKCILTEKKKHINKIYDGYVFQLYAQYFALIEMGYDVKKIKLYSIDDNKVYNVKLPEEDVDMKLKFEKLINDIKSFDIHNFEQTSQAKCDGCIYEPSCDRSLVC